ncbi:MAG TPA: glycosyltransferase family 2 protein [Elusimicrobiota bacterium]|nr:glycosyltransferase family 2 protein [Elusimicrobiota bacterium]
MKTLCVIIPCLNEEKTIGNVISRIPKHISGIDKIATIVIDDGSTDNSGSIARSHGARIIRNSVSRGVGYAFRAGIEESLRQNADIVVNIDGDGQFNPEDIESLIAPLCEDAADIVTASRFKNKEFHLDMPKTKYWGNQIVSRIVSFLTGLQIHDASCGFRAYNQKAALNINLFGDFTYTHEVLLDLAFKGMRICELPLQIRGVREHGTSRVAHSLLNYAFHSLRIMFNTYRDFKPFKLFSTLSLIFFIISSALGAFFFGHYLVTGRFSGHLWAGFLSGFMFFTALSFFITALITDKLSRMRENQERILFTLKRNNLEHDQSSIHE